MPFRRSWMTLTWPAARPPMTIVASAMNRPRGPRSSGKPGSEAFGRGACAGAWPAARRAVWAGATTGSETVGTDMAPRRPPSCRSEIAAAGAGATRAWWTASTWPLLCLAGFVAGAGACLPVVVLPPAGAGAGAGASGGGAVGVSVGSGTPAVWVTVCTVWLTTSTGSGRAVGDGRGSGSVIPETGEGAEPEAGVVAARAVPPKDRQSNSAPPDTVATRRLVEVWVISRPSAVLPSSTSDQGGSDARDTGLQPLDPAMPAS